MRRPGTALAEIPAGPCAQCEQAAKCSAERLACLTFSAFSHTGKFNASRPRKPTARLYSLLFNAPEDVP